MRQLHERNGWRGTIRDFLRWLNSFSFKHKYFLTLAGFLISLFTLIVLTIDTFSDSDQAGTEVDGVQVEVDSVQVNWEKPLSQRPPGTGESVTGADQKAETEETKRFTVADFSDPSLISLIEEKTDYIHNKGSRHNRVHLTYTGTIQEVNDGLYWYEGGYLKAQVDDFSCFVLRDVKIGPTLRVGNPRPAVENQLRKQVTDAVSEHRSTIASRLVECFK